MIREDSVGYALVLLVFGFAAGSAAFEAPRNATAGQVERGRSIRTVAA